MLGSPGQVPRGCSCASWCPGPCPASPSPTLPSNHCWLPSVPNGSLGMSVGKVRVGCICPTTSWDKAWWWCPHPRLAVPHHIQQVTKQGQPLPHHQSRSLVYPSTKVPICLEVSHQLLSWSSRPIGRGNGSLDFPAPGPGCTSYHISHAPLSQGRAPGGLGASVLAS